MQKGSKLGGARRGSDGYVLQSWARREPGFCARNDRFTLRHMDGVLYSFEVPIARWMADGSCEMVESGLTASQRRHLAEARMAVPVRCRIIPVTIIHSRS